jgi:hypothetical protein
LLYFPYTAFFLLPVLFEKKYIQHGLLLIGQMEYTKHFSNLSTLFWFSKIYSLTPFFLIIIFISLSVLIIKKQIIPKWLHLNLCLLFTLLIFSLFMITPQSRILYEHLPYLKYLQFPWRWLSPVMVITSILSGSISFLFIKHLMAGNKAEQKKPSPFFTTILILLVFSSALVFLNMSDIRKTYVHWPDEYFSPENIRTQNLRATYLAEYRPVWAADEPDTAGYQGVGMRKR